MLFESASKADTGEAMLRLRKGSVIRALGPPFRRNGQFFVRNRKGFFIEADRLEPVPMAEQSLGASFLPTEPVPQGIVTGADAKVRAAPQSDAPEIASLARWSWIPSHPASVGPGVAADFGWIRLPGGGYVEEMHISRFRKPIMPAALGPEERWIAIDLQEQLAAAYEGQTLVRLMPCSTGLKGNTPPGEYRIQHKRRLHTMRLRMGQIRVEDVPWVIFFDRQEALAIHTAYWHNDFGAPRSHGCVNVPENDARWLYEWSWPVPAPEDSETMAFPASSGTRIIVFR
jgi:lipoprotein-anchoring transpeptidase ErfK/SrfK